MGGVSRCVSCLTHLSLSLSLSCAEQSTAERLTEGTPAGGWVRRARVGARRSILAALASLSALAGGVLLAPSAALAEEESCPNAALRIAFSAGLPDCRAYEQVTSIEPEFQEFNPNEFVNVSGGEGSGTTRGVWAAVTGDRIAYPSNEPPAGSPSDGIYFMSTRGPDGWSTQDLIPPQSPNYLIICKTAYTPAFTSDLSSAVLADGDKHNEAASCGSDDPSLVAGEPQGYQNLFLQDNESGSHQLVDLTPAGVAPNDAWFQVASTDLSHIVFSERAALVPGAPPDTGSTEPYEDLYELAGGVVRLVTILPDGTPTEGALANGTVQELPWERGLGSGGGASGSAVFTHAVSDDGSRVFFKAGGDLYVREHADREQSPLNGEGRCADPADACTVQVDASQAGGAGGGGRFMWASADGSLVFFTDGASAGLTADTVPGSGTNLYRYDLETGALVDLTPAAQAGVQGVSGVSEDGSYVYFVAEGDLSGPQVNSQGAHAEAGQPNLYLVHGAGGPTFIATLDPEDSSDWSVQSEENGSHFSEEQSRLTARVSANGQFVAFNSLRSLTGYDNTAAEGIDCGVNHTTVPCQEIFLYEAAQSRLVCVSCDPSGARPTAPAGLLGPAGIEFGDLAGRAPLDLQRNVLDDGRVFFDTAEALVPRDTNDQYDVYEYEGGQPHLISTGTSSDASFFYEASPSGEDVFIVTAQQLPSGRPVATTSVYDARVDGGFPEQLGITACSEEDCKGTFSASPAFVAPSSATFAGAGNLTVAPTVAKVKQVKRKTKRKRHPARKKRGRGRGGRGRTGRSIHGNRGGVR